MKINKAELLAALEVVKPGIKNQETVEQATAFAFINGRVVTYNDDISLSHPVADLELEGAVQAKELYDILKKMKGEEIEFEEGESSIFFKSGRAKAGLNLQVEIRMPLEEIGEIEGWKKLPEDFSHFLKFAMATCVKDLARPMLVGVHVREDGFMESSDNKRLTQCELGEGIPVPNFILPASSCKEVVKLNPTKIAAGDGWVHFKNKDKSQLSCRILEDTFPSVEKFFDFEGLVINFPDNMIEVIDRANVFAQSDDSLQEEMEISLKKNRVTVRTKNDSGWFEESVKMEYTEEPFSFIIIPYLLRDILKEGSGCTVGEKMLQFEGAGWKYASVLKAN
jgi:DNA polymerase III sliding clamp (beta) subunit (PCNA family)